MNPSPESPPALNIQEMLNGYADRAAKHGVQQSADDRFQEAAVDYSKNGSALYGDRVPTQGINAEKPEHVLMCYMQAQGKSAKEIAAATGYHENTVRVIQRQPWFRARFLRIVKENGDDEVKALLNGEVVNSITTLIEIRDTEKSARPHVSAAAANSILDRALGKPTQHIESETTINVNKAAKLGADLQQQISAVEQELQSRGIVTGAN